MGFGPNYENKPDFPVPWEDGRAKKEYVQRGTIVNPKFASRTGVSEEDDLTQYYDCDEVLHEKAKVLADAIRNCNHLVAYSGAGISVSAGIGDFRGPDGCWTLQARGLKSTKQSLPVDQLKPTFAHRALVELHKIGKLKCVVTTNFDALHERSGIPQEALCELHGNAFVERCETCQHEVRHDFVVRCNRERFTGRMCDQPNCGGRMKDSVVAFSESLPEAHLERAKEHSKKADVALVLGTSMRLKPACYLPELCWFNSKLNDSIPPGKFFLVNLQKTDYDPHAYVRFFHTTDRVMQLVMEMLNIPVP